MILSPEDRTAMWCRAFGWQGGTIHQIADVTGCSVGDLLYTPDGEHDSEIAGGWFAARTCTPEWRHERLYPANRGNLRWWLGLAQGFKSLEVVPNS